MLRHVLPASLDGHPSKLPVHGARRPGILAVAVIAGAILGLRPTTAAAAEVVHLTTQDWPPYQMIVAGKIDGIAVRVVACVLERLGFVADVAVQPWPLAQRLVREGAADGFFSSTRDDDRDRFASLSAAIVPQTWMWYWRRERTVDVGNRAIRVGTQGDTAIAAWLGEHGYGQLVIGAGVSDLIALLKAGRVDAVLANQAVMDWRLAISGEAAGTFASSVHSEQMLGVYFAKTFLTGHPGFLDRFNGETADCRMGAHLPD